jgi:precorrin-6B methylase 2
MSQQLAAVYDSQGAQYEEAFGTFLAHTDQKEKARQWIDAAVAALPARDVFIDVGAGNGKVTAWYLSQFGRTIAIEPNPHLRQQLAETCPGAEVLSSMILETQPSALGNFVLCSHVFYYIDQAEWMPNLERLASFLAPGGLLAVILQNEATDCMGMLAQFHGRKFEHAFLAREFQAQHAAAFDVAVETVPCHITTSSFDVAYVIAEFMLNVLPLANPPLRADLEAYIRNHFQDPQYGYRFSCSQDFLQIRRKQ